MKKLIIGLLIVAAGAGTYMYFQHKKSDTEKPGTDHALIIGNWKADTLQHKTSGIFSDNSFQFSDSSTLILTGPDSLAKKDTLQYSWEKNGQLSWKHKGDSTSVTYLITSLGKDSLQLRSADSSHILLIKAH